jgi:holo-[acyl-carrier protein] synthase
MLLYRNMQIMEKISDFVVPGIGVDVVDVDRMKFALERTPRIRQRLFTEAEITYCEKFRFAERHYAGRWAAKEAVTKALGCGLIQWNGVEVVRRRRQAPTVRIFGKIERFADMVGVREEELQISITHSELSAVAVCVFRPTEQNAGVTPGGSTPPTR